MRTLARISVVLLLIGCFAAVCFAATATKAKTQAKLSIAVNDKGIIFDPKAPVGDRDYTVIVKNFSSQPLGLKFSGKDKAGSQFARYTNVLQKGKSESFRFYFPSNSTLAMREINSLQKRDGSVTKVTFGNKTGKIKFK